MHQGTETQHYWFKKSTSGADEKLTILNMQEEQQGLYEIVLKNGACEARNVVEVKLQGL